MWSILKELATNHVLHVRVPRNLRAGLGIVKLISSLYAKNLGAQRRQRAQQSFVCDTVEVHDVNTLGARTVLQVPHHFAGLMVVVDDAEY